MVIVLDYRLCKQICDYQGFENLRLVETINGLMPIIRAEAKTGFASHAASYPTGSAACSVRIADCGLTRIADRVISTQIGELAQNGHYVACVGSLLSAWALGRPDKDALRCI